MAATEAVQILKKVVQAMSMAKNRIRKTGKKRNRNLSAVGVVKLKIGGLP